MANMSYVAFENTTRALEQCIDLMKDELDGGEELSSREFAHAQRMFQQFREYGETMQKLVQSRSNRVESNK